MFKWLTSLISFKFIRPINIENKVIGVKTKISLTIKRFKDFFKL